MADIFDIQKSKDTITPSLKKLVKELNKNVPQFAYKSFVENTPRGKTGHAQSNTKLAGSTIVAAYPYARVLDNGSSPKAPKGMSKPMIQAVDKYIKKILRRK